MEGLETYGSSGVFTSVGQGSWGEGHEPRRTGGSFNLDSNRQTSYQNLKFSNNETRPKSKFFSLLIYAGYPA